MPVKKGFIIKAIGIGTGVSLAVILILLCVICGVLMMIPGVPFASLPYIVLIADAIGAFIGGWVAASITGEKGMLFGFITGVCAFLCLLLFGLCSGGITLDVIALVRFAVLALCGIFGGIKAVNRREKLHIR